MHRLTNNWNLKLISLVLAVLLWSHVRGEVNPLETMTVDVPLRARAPRGFVIVNNDSLPAKVSVVLRGPRLALRDIKGGSLANPLAPTEQAPNIVSGAVRADLDLSKAHVGTQSVAVKVETTVPDVEALGAKPAEVSVTLDRAKGQSFSVRPGFNPVPNSDAVAENILITPPQAIVYGASQSMARISQIRAQADGRVFENGVPHEVQANLIALDTRGNEIEDVRIFPDTVQVRATLREQQITRRVTLQAKLRGKPALGYQIGKVALNPSHIIVRGTRSALAKLSALPLEIELSGARDATLQQRITLDLPRGVSAVGTRSVLVTVSISPVSANLSESTASPLGNLPPQTEKPDAANRTTVPPVAGNKKAAETSTLNNEKTQENVAPETSPPAPTRREF